MCAQLDKITETVVNRLKRYGLQGRTIKLKVKYSDFRQITRNQSFPRPVGNAEIIAATAKNLLSASGVENISIRLLGITWSNFGELPAKMNKGNNNGQLAMF